MEEVHSPDEGRIKCTECDKTFMRKEFMVMHRSTFHDRIPSPHQCEICKKIFSQPGTLNRHKRNVHSGEKKHECEECVAKFARKEDLKKHIQMGKHYFTKEANLLCPYCEGEIVFKSWKTWQKHYVKHPKSGKETCVNVLKREKKQETVDKKGQDR